MKGYFFAFPQLPHQEVLPMHILPLPLQKECSFATFIRPESLSYSLALRLPKDTRCLQFVQGKGCSI
jgi:hypothetical protein